MTGVMRGLLEGVFDYAGLFPSTELSMHGAVSAYLRHQKGPESEVLNRFVCPSSRLEELRIELDRHGPTEPVALTVVGSKGGNWGDGLVHDAESMTRFIEYAGDLADIEAFEIRAPDHENLSEYLGDLRAFNQVDVFCELPWGTQMSDSLGLIAEQDWLGVKARVGGLMPDSFPTSPELAGFLQQCIQLELPYKLTAGLHHPFRSYRDEVQTKMHGFLNVMVAAVMLHAHDLSAKEAADILESESPSDFKFNDQFLQFRDWTADLEDIEDMRELFVGIGSCSVEEPVQDLKSHNL